MGIGYGPHGYRHNGRLSPSFHTQELQDQRGDGVLFAVPRLPAVEGPLIEWSPTPHHTASAIARGSAHAAPRERAGWKGAFSRLVPRARRMLLRADDTARLSATRPIFSPTR